MAGYNAQQEFIDNYRNAQAEKTAQIGEQAHALGSDLTAQYGGLHGPSEYWLSRYQTPQTESRLAGLRAANQAQALNQLMKNDLEREAEKYNQAYRNYQKRARNYAAGGNPVTTTGNGDSKQGKVNFISLESLRRAGTTEPGISTVYDTETKQPTATTVIPSGFGNAAIDQNGNVIYDVYTYPSDGSRGERIFQGSAPALTNVTGAEAIEKTIPTLTMLTGAGLGGF